MSAIEHDLSAAVEPPRSLLAPRTSARKEEILDGLEAIVLDKGFRGLRLADVATQLNTSFATLYDLAPTKDELVTLVVDRWYQRSTPPAYTLMRACTNPADRLLAWVRDGFEGAGRPSPAFWEDVASHAAISQLVARYAHYWVQILEAIVAEGVRDGAFRSINPKLVAMTWEAAGSTFRDPHFFRELDKPIRDLAEEWVDLILNGLFTPETSRRYKKRQQRRDA